VRVARLGYVSVPIDRPPIVSVEFFGDDEGHCFAWVHGVMIGPVLPPDLSFEVFRVPESWHVVHRVERQPLEAMTATSWPPPWAVMDDSVYDVRLQQFAVLWSHDDGRSDVAASQWVAWDERAGDWIARGTPKLHVQMMEALAS
jgi:hypothetical protein